MIGAFCWDRGLDGWWIRQAMESVVQLETDDSSRVVAKLGYPRETQLLSEMMLHVEALRALFAAEVPHSVSIRPTDKGEIRSIIRDASAKGFGSRIWDTKSGSSV